jgi:U3 small nucleolar RNA-associated protein 10
MISTRYKRRVLCYLLSHVQALSLPTAEVVLLKLVENVSDKAKAQILTPVITDLVAADVPLQGSIQEDLTSLCISSFDSSTTNDLNQDHASLWDLYISTIRRFFLSGTICA